MDIFHVFRLLGGLAMFLFGMDTMSKSLQKQAGGKLQKILGAFTGNPLKGFLLGMAVTAVIQSSGATTVMVVGFVNSGVMTLRQAIGAVSYTHLDVYKRQLRQEGMRHEAAQNGSGKKDDRPGTAGPL